MRTKFQIKNKELVILSVIFIAGTLLRFFRLSYQSIWIDEFCTARFAANKDLFLVFWDVMARDMHPPTFYMLEHLFCGIFGYSEFTLRFLPFIFGTASMFVFYRLVRAFFSAETSLIAAALFCLNPYQIYYAQEGRSYSMFLLVTLLMTYYFLMSIKYNTFMAGPFIFWSIMGIYTHAFAVILLIVMNAVYLIGYRDELRPHLWLKAQVIIALFLLPLFPFFLKGSAAESYYENRQMLLAPFYSLKNYIFGITFDWNFMTLMLFIAALYLIIIGTFTYRQKSAKITMIIFLISAGFMMFPWLISVLLGKAIYSERTFILVSALVLVLLAVGISYLSMQGKALAMTVMLLIYGTALYNYYFVEKYQKSLYKSQYQELVKEFKPGDIIIHSNTASYTSFEFYSRYEYRVNLPNRMLDVIPEFHGSGLRFKIRELWRQFKEEVLKKKFGLEIYAGFDKNIITPEQAMNVHKDYDRIWFVSDNVTGTKQPWMPIGNMWASELDLRKPVDPLALPWVNRYYKPVKVEKFFADDIYLLERK